MFSYYFSTIWLPPSPKNSKSFLCTSRTQTRKSFRLSSHNTSLLRPPLLLYRTLPLSFHGKSPGRISVSDILLLPTGARSANWQLLCLSTLEIYSNFQKYLPLFPKGNTPGDRTLFPEAGCYNNSFYTRLLHWEQSPMPRTYSLLSFRTCLRKPPLQSPYGQMCHFSRRLLHLQLWGLHIL